MPLVTAPDDMPFEITLLIARPSAAKQVMPSTRVTASWSHASDRGETPKATRPSTIVVTAMSSDVASTLVRWPAEVARRERAAWPGCA